MAAIGTVALMVVLWYLLTVPAVHAMIYYRAEDGRLLEYQICFQPMEEGDAIMFDGLRDIIGNRAEVLGVSMKSSREWRWKEQEEKA